MANTLKASVQIDVSKAERNLARLMKKINDVNSAVNKTNSSNKKVEDSIKRKTNAEEQFNSKVKEANKSIHKQKNLFDSIAHSLKGLAATYLGVMGATAMINTSDTITSAENKFNHMNGGDTAATQQQLDKMYHSAQKVRMGYADMMSNVGKSMTLAGDAFGDNIDNAIRFQEIMAQAYTLGGASAAEQSSSMYQMIQGLGSGILQGDELRSVREGAPLAYKAIEEFAQGIYGAEENLKDLASQGKITSDIVVAAIMRAGEGAEGLDAQFKKTSMTFAQAGIMLKNTATKAFEPVLQQLNDILNSEQGKKFITIISNALIKIASVLGVVLNVVTVIFNFVIEHWNFFKPLILGGLALIISMIITMQFALFKMFAIATLGVIKTNIAMAGWIAVFTAILICINRLNKGVSDAATYIANIALVVAIVIMGALTAMAVKALLTGAIFTMSFGMWALFVIAIILVLLAAFLSFTEQIVGFVYAAGAFIWNIVIGIVNGIIQFLWTMFAVPWMSIIEWVLNVFNGGFNSFGDAVKNLLGNIISWFLSLGKVVTKIIDAIFGTNWTGGLESLQGKLLEWGKNENAITLNKNMPDMLQRVSVTNAWDAGYAKGGAIKSSINEWGSGLKDKFSTNALADKLGLNYSNFDDIAAADAKTADNTGKMADSMQLAEEDLEYLKNIAHMEWKKEYTTASIKIDMTNNNTINDAGDWEGWFNKLGEVLNEELSAQAQGVYAY